MNISKEVELNLISIFYSYLETLDLNKDLRIEDALISIYKIFDFDYNRENKSLSRLDSIYTKSLVMESHDIFCSKITPQKIESFDLECIEDLLNNKYRIEAPRLGGVFSSIGWVLRLEGDTFRLHFIGGPDYDIWKEPAIKWDFDLDEECKDWKNGTDFIDGYDLNKDIPEHWTEDLLK